MVRVRVGVSVRVWCSGLGFNPYLARGAAATLTAPDRVRVRVRVRGGGQGKG